MRTINQTPVSMISKLATLKFAGADLPPRTIRARITDETVDRAGDIVVASGCDSAAYNRNPIVLLQHDPTKPIARAKLIPSAGAIDAEIRFPDPGVSAQADEALGLVRAGVLGAVSIGFTPIEQSPLHGGGCKFSKFELLEISLVSVPANPNALVLQKAATSPAALAAKAKAALDKVERHHVDALDALDAVKAGDLSTADALAQLRTSLTKARKHADVATDAVRRLLYGDVSPPDDELSFSPARTKAALAALDARDVGRSAVDRQEPPREIGGAWLATQVRAAELDRLRRI